MSLRDWLSNGWLIEHRTSPREIAELLQVVDRDLADCQAPQLSPDWQLQIAYNAALQVATAALAAAGYRAAREAHHYRTLQSLAHTIGTDPAVSTQLDGFRKKRNIGEYERAGGASAQEAREMCALATRLRDDLLTWLRRTHTDLLPE